MRMHNAWLHKREHLGIHNPFFSEVIGAQAWSQGPGEQYSLTGQACNFSVCSWSPSTYICVVFYGSLAQDLVAKPKNKLFFLAA